MRAAAPSNTMFSCGNHSQVPSLPTITCTRWLALRPNPRYHFPALGVVICAFAPTAASTAISSESPPATPPGGCTTIAWHTSPPSGYSGRWITSGPTCSRRCKRVRPCDLSKPRFRRACQPPIAIGSTGFIPQGTHGPRPHPCLRRVRISRFLPAAAPGSGRPDRGQSRSTARPAGSPYLPCPPGAGSPARCP
jgi:hypothetical protein